MIFLLLLLKFKIQYVLDFKFLIKMENNALNIIIIIFNCIIKVKIITNAQKMLSNRILKSINIHLMCKCSFKRVPI